MNTSENILSSHSRQPVAILGSQYPIASYIPLNLSEGNQQLKHWDVTNPTECQAYIDSILDANGGLVAYGGYLEHRNLYTDKASFNSRSEQPRNIHLGIDYWAPANTTVVTPLDGTVHSFNNNYKVGDYGPTIILEHQIEDTVFYTLYGHLSLESLDNLAIGKSFEAGSILATLGTPEINVNYAPHLHFQIIKDLQGYKGDYPGVCTQNNLGYYKENCPDPNLLLKLG